MLFGFVSVHPVRFAATLALFSSACALSAAAGDLFASDAMLSIELRAPLTSIYAQRKLEERDQLPGTVHFQSAAGTAVALDVDVRTRGNFRRLHCLQAPLLLRFKKKQVAGTIFQGERKLKLVSPCRKGSRYENIIVAEYLVYKIYEQLSDYHFRVRPLTITFTDTDRQGKTRESFGFFIEDLGDMAKRYNREVPDWEGTKFRNLDLNQLAVLDLFQFMVGGHDWSAVASLPGERCCHNVRLLKKPGVNTDVIPVAYDFDLTGIVNAPYAFPPENIPIKNVRQRYFRGRCKSDALWQSTFAHFRAQRSAIDDLYAAALTERAPVDKKAVKYLAGFYAILDNPKRTKRLIYDRCTQMVTAAGDSL